MPENIPAPIAQISESLRETNFNDHQQAYDTAVQLRRAADQIENSAMRTELRQAPWWEDPDPGVRVSRR